MTETLVVLLSVAVCVGIGISPLASIATVDPQGPTARAMRRAEQQFAAAVMLAATCSLVTLGVFGKSGEAFWPLLLLLAGAVPLVHPWLLARYLFVPLGAVRSAYVAGRLAGHPWFRDPVGGAVLTGVLASMRRRRHDPRRAQWLRHHLDGARVGGAGVVALGLLAADAGDRETARVILGSLDEIEPEICPPLARTIALDWLVADAARRGAWHELVERVSDDPFPTRTTRFIGACARRMLGESISRRSIFWSWLGVPRRLRTVPLLWSALRRPRTPAPAILDAELSQQAANGGTEPTLTALALHAEVAAIPTTQPVAVAVVERLADAWDLALGDFELRGQVRRRGEALLLDTPGELLVARLQRAVARDLAHLMAQCGRESTRLMRSTGILRRARDIHFEETIEHLTHACAELGRRRDAAWLPSEAWVRWVRMRRAYLVAVVPLDLEQRAVVYAAVEQEVRQTAAWLWNDRRERGLAHAMCLFLLAEAEHVKDAEAAAYYRHNVVVGL
jgi:hypothetical protein